MTKLSTKQVVWIGAGFIVVFLVVSVLVSYATNSTDPVSSAFKKLYPAASVGSRLVSIEDADEFVGLVQKADSTVTASTAFDVFLTHQKSQSVMKKLGLKLDSDAVSDEFTFYSKGSADSIKTLIDTYFGGSEKLFIDNIVYPEVVEARLRMKYNSDFATNSVAYQKAEGILEQLNQGKKFEDLAKAESDDKQSAQFGGDMGFFEHGEILPELEREIVVAKEGEVHDIIVTRDGYEIVLPIETSTTDGKKMWHAKHILIKTNGFEQWLTNQQKNISVKIFKKY